MNQKEKKADQLLTILKDDSVQNCLVVCIILWIVIVIKFDWSNGVSYLSVLVIMAIMLFTLFTIIYFVCRAMKKICKEENTNMYEICKECAQNSSKYEFASFDFYTLKQITDIERKMGDDVNPSECLITIYTSSLDTEEDDSNVRSVVKHNLEKGVKYKIYFLRGIPTKKQLEMYGKDNLIKYVGNPNENKDLDLAAEFDIIVFQDSFGEKSGYFSINFSTSVAPRPCAQGFVCENQCHYENENLLYKKMREDSTNLLLYTLKQWSADYKI